MAVRKKRRKATARRGKVGRDKGVGTDRQAKMTNRRALWQTYKTLQNQADKALEKFRTDVKKEAKSDVLLMDHAHLLLLLGECNYMARECMRFAAKQAKKR